MKYFEKLVALLIAVATALSIFAGCSNKVSYDEKWLTKGEFIMIFAEETGIDMYANPYCDLELSKDSKYFAAASALVEYGALTKKEAVSDLDNAVTKEFVAELCVENLYFRETSDVVLKDASKLNDPQACKDAVGHNIVSIENGYFDANEKMSYEDCKAAIDRMLYIDATTKFDPDEAEIEVIYKDNVIDLTIEIAEEDIIFYDPSHPDYESILATFDDSIVEVDNANSDRVAVTQLSKIKSTPAAIKEISSEIKPYKEAQVGDLVMMTLPRSHPKIYKVGDLIVFGLMNGYTLDFSRPDPLALCGIVEEVASPYLGLGQGYKIRIASDEEALEAAKLNKYTSGTSEKWKVNKTIDDNELSKYGISDVEVRGVDNGVSITVKQTVSNDVKHWSEAKYEGDITYEFAVKNIDLTVDGFGDVLTGNIKNAVCVLDYTIENTFDASIKLKGAPANNGNGKFLSNLKRSRLTGYNAAGADEIKVARLYVDLGWGFKVETYIYLTITIEGEINITLSTDCQRGFKIKNNKCTPIKKNENTKKLEVNANAEAALHFDFALKWGSKKSKPWVDVNFTAGVGLDAQAQVIENSTIENSAVSVTPICGYFPAQALQYAKTESDIDVCFNCEIYIFYQIDGLTDSCLVGKLIRVFNKDFELTTKKQTVPIFKLHIEDTGIVDECTLLSKNEEDSESETKEDAGDFKLNSSKVFIPEFTCSSIKLLELPVKRSELGSMGDISVRTTDPKIATAHIYKDFIVIEGNSAGSTSLIIETKNKRFYQECSVTVEPNSYID